MKSKFLITGFEAFGGDSLNPTQILLDWVPSNSGFETQLLPVEFAKAHQLILQRSDLNELEGILCFGLAAGRSKISLERVGLNWTEASIADNANVKPAMGTIDQAADPAYFTKAPIEKIKQVLHAAGLPVEVSLSAGGYVCNHLYFQLLKAQVKPWVIFIHVPYLPEQGKQPSLSREDLEKMLKTLMQSLRAD